MAFRASGGGAIVTGEPQLALPIGVTDGGEVRTYHLVLPFLPMSKNQYDGMPGQWQHSVKGKWRRAIETRCAELLIPKGNTRLGLSARLWFANNNRRDVQNYAQTLWHWVPDALVRAGVLIDDRTGAIQFGSGGNLGVTMMYDNRTGVPKVKRERTELTISLVVRP